MISKKFLINKSAILYEKISNKLIASIRRSRLKNTDFTIISNNCWGGHVYRRYGIPYQSPTVGLYFFADDYLTLLENFEDVLFSDLKMIDQRDSKHYETLCRKGQQNVPVGVLKYGVEVIFLHYKDNEEALNKWNRRLKRVNMNNLIVKFSAMNECSQHEIKRFEVLNFKKKLLFIANREQSDQGVVVAKYVDGNQVVDDTTFYASIVPLDEVINGAEYGKDQNTIG